MNRHLRNGFIGLVILTSIVSLLNTPARAHALHCTTDVFGRLVCNDPGFYKKPHPHGKYKRNKQCVAPARYRAAAYPMPVVPWVRIGNDHPHRGNFTRAGGWIANQGRGSTVILVQR